MASSVYFSILLTLCNIQVSHSEPVMGIREVKLCSLELSHDNIVKGSDLWGSKTCVSCIQCAILCVIHKECTGVFYNQNSNKCQGHDGNTTTVSRQPDRGTKYLSGIKFLNADKTGSPDYRRDVEAKLEYHVYTTPIRWIKAEMFCADRGERLLRLDTIHKFNRVLLYLRSRIQTRTVRIYVGGYCCCNGKTFWGTDHSEPMSKKHFESIPHHPFNKYVSWISGADYSGRYLHLARLSRTPHMYVCERYNH